VEEVRTVPYFTAALVSDGATWKAADVDVDSADDLGELADRLRGAAVGDSPALLLLEREDAWFAVVRVDGDEDPRVFVTDGPGGRASPYADVLGLDPEDEDEGPVGDVDVLADLGTGPVRLQELAGEDGPPTGDAVAEVADAAGFAEVLDALR
jgi:putative tRNA adenosine deaminase-associated protein